MYLPLIIYNQVLQHKEEIHILELYHYHKYSKIVYGPQGQPAQQFIPAPVANHAVPVPQVIQQQALDQARTAYRT
jgi:hypothetical protein